MKSWFFLFILIVNLVAGCAPLRAGADKTDDVVRLIGDDIARLASQNGDDLAQTSKQYAINAGSKYSDEVTLYWDDLLRFSQAIDEETYVLIYRNAPLSPVQYEFVGWLKADIGLEDDEALLFLQNVCFVAGFYRDFAEPPDTSDTQQYIERVAEQNNINVFAIADFTESAIDLVKWLITQDESYTPQEAASLLFDGLCLVTEIQ